MRKNSYQVILPNQKSKDFTNILKDLSTILIEIIYNLNKKGLNDVKYVEIFIDINNVLNDIYNNKLEEDNFIFKMLIKFDELLINFNDKITTQSLDFKVMDDCISFKFLYYNIISLFPNGQFVNDFILDEMDAETWWSANFKNDIFIEVNIFWQNISKVFPNITGMEEFLKSLFFTTNTWFNESINKSLFNIFLRFYGGWKDFESTWLSIHSHSGHLIMYSLKHAINEFEHIKFQPTEPRSAEKSYVFCLNYWSDQGLWNIVYVDENNETIIKLIKANSLLQEISNIKDYQQCL